MECTYCPGNEATCHLTKLVNGVAVDVHVCEKCIPEIAKVNLVDFDIWDAVAKLAKQKGQPDPGKEVEPEPVEEISAKSLLMKESPATGSVCPKCGFTSEELRKTGRLGCSHCYEVFAPMLEDIMNDCQKSLQHTGKVPSRLRCLRKSRIEEELRKAVDEERYEDAALLRDQLESITE